MFCSFTETKHKNMKKTTDQRITELESELKELDSCVQYLRGIIANRHNRGIISQLHERVLSLEDKAKKEPQKTINSRINNIEFILWVVAVFAIFNSFLILTYINK